jgi:hypothetical protein
MMYQPDRVLLQDETERSGTEVFHDGLLHWNRHLNFQTRDAIPSAVILYLLQNCDSVK